MKQITLLLLLAASTLPSLAQELTKIKYWDKNQDSTGKENAVTYTVTTYTDSTQKAYTTKSYSIGGHLRSAISYYDSTGKRWQLDGSYLTYHEDGKPKIKGSFIKGKLNGELTTWHANGQLKRKDEYVLDSLINGQCYSANGQDTAWFPFHISFKYGNHIQEVSDIVRKNIRYPKSAYKAGFEGTVQVQFIVEKDATLSGVRIRRSVSAEIDAEALRVFRAIPARWKPALEDGEPQRGYGILPIVFKLERQW
jgi:TonB family protein